MSSPPPTKKRVGRATKLYTSDQVRDMIAKYHDFREMVDFSKKYDKLFEIHCKSSVSGIIRPPTKTWRHFTQKKKYEVHLHYSISGNYCETARAFAVLYPNTFVYSCISPKIQFLYCLLSSVAP